MEEKDKKSMEERITKLRNKIEGFIPDYNALLHMDKLYLKEQYNVIDEETYLEHLMVKKAEGKIQAKIQEKQEKEKEEALLSLQGKY